MSHFTHKHCKTITLFILIFSATTILPTWNFYNAAKYPQLQTLTYNDTCFLITTGQLIRGTALLVYYLATHKKLDLDKAVEVIQKRLQEYETSEYALEQEILTAIKEKFNISDELWDRCMTDIKQLKEINKKAMQFPWQKIQHDKNLPSDLIDTVKSLLLKNSINPNSIHLLNVIDTEEKEEILARACFSINYSTDSSNNNLIIAQEYNPQSIEFLPQTKNISNEEKIAICAHEVQHLIQQHGIITLVILYYLKHYYALEEKTIEESSEYQKLKQIHESQAEILSAIKDPEIACCLRILRAKSFYPKYLYEKHYYHLSSIYMLWKVQAWLEYAKIFSWNNLLPLYLRG